MSTKKDNFNRAVLTEIWAESIMFAKYKISINVVNQLIRNTLQRNLLLESQREVNNRTSQLLENVNGVIDGDSLKNGYFKTDFKNQFRIFISHSHRDIETIEKFAQFIENNYGIKCFVDSMVWKNVASLQKRIDNKYSRNTNGNLDYYSVMQTTAHIHSLLSIALFEMIDQCECCIFVGSDNSLNFNFNQLSTFSPWIYEELYYMNHTEIMPTPEHITDYGYKVLHQQTRLFDSQIIKMTHNIDLSDFIQLTSNVFNTSLKNDFFLNHLYFQTSKISK